ncbi:MAG: PorT family protein [Bacteroidetes bacterium]|nr:PorT family protein [Bacteroidota bacterium]
MNINAKILTLMLLGLLISNLYAQDDNFKNDPVVDTQKDVPTFRLGLHFSPNIAWLNLNTTGYSSNGSRIGFAYGLSTEFYIAKNYLISTGFSINNVGGRLQYESVYDNNGVLAPSEIKQTIKINYVDIPLSIKLKTNEIGYVTYYGNFGFNVGIKYNSKTDIEYLDFKNIKQTDVANTDNVSLININLIVGGGLEYNISGNTNLAVGITFHNGFTNIIKSKTHVLDTNGKAIIDSSGEAVYTDKEVSSNLNFFSLDLAIYF